MSNNLIKEFKDPDYRSLHQFFLNSAHHIHTPDTVYLSRKESGIWVDYTYRDLLAYVDCLTGWLMSRGLQKGDRVALILENSPEFYCIDQSLQKLGIINVSIYPTLTADETAFILNDSGARILFVGNPFLLKKFKKVEDKCPTVEVVVSFPEDVQTGDKLLTYKQVLEQGRGLHAAWTEQIETRFKEVGHDDIATLIYTSGTTGVPKGAMLTHYNFLSNCYDANDLVPDITKDDKFLSFLPLSHVFERMAYYLTTYLGSSVAFAENIDKVAQNIAEVRPTLMAAVPRLLERVHDRVMKSGTEAGGMKAKIFLWSLGVGEKARHRRDAGKSNGPILSVQYALANKLVFSKIKEKMGGRLKLFVSGGGALPPHVGEFFANLGIQVQEGFGLTETSPFITVNEYNRQVYGTVGRVAPRQQVAIQNPDTKEIYTVQTYHTFKPDFASEEGEILAKGPNIMKGYWNNKAETDKVFDEDGWFHTGDIGRFEKGYLKITDRLKNMLVTSLGKNIYPTQLENNFLKSPRIEQIFIIGDKQEFITAIIVPAKEEALAQGMDSDLFEGENVFVENEKLRNWLMEDVKKYNENIAKFERVKDFLIKRTPFSI
ncbi:MAG: long-chain fatty acid--CoA ligase, partial [Bacteroidetes bacterium]|nr:long-chain fatty acid--CoA ligase [Bacteroidota bacterium]